MDEEDGSTASPWEKRFKLLCSLPSLIIDSLVSIVKDLWKGKDPYD